MEPTRMTYKGRERIRRGILQNFNDLPDQVQKDFKKIKLFLVEFVGKDLDVYVHGSYKHGYWDEYSDYDVIIYETIDKSIDKYILEGIGLKTNVFSTDNKIGVILIP
jgi:hypothetical protein